MFVFSNNLLCFVSCYLRFEICLFALLPTHFPISGTHSIFLSKFYDQIDDTAMRSPLMSPVLADLFIGVFRKKRFQSLEKCEVMLHRRYMADNDF